VVHHPVISFGVFHEPRIGPGVEPFVTLFGEAIDLLLEQVLEHLDDTDLAPGIAFEQCVAAVERRVLGPWIEASVTEVREPRALAKRSKNSPKIRSSMSGSGSAVSAMSVGRSSSSVSSIFPSLFADQRNEPHTTEILLLEDSVFLLGHLDELLNPAGLADR